MHIVRTAMPQQSPPLSTLFASSDDGVALQNTLDTVRETLGMEVAYLSEFIQERAVFHAVSAPGLEAMIRPSQSMDLREVYCKHILDGGLPSLMTDTSQHAIATDLPITQMIPIGSHLSVPVRRADGTVFGMFCFLSRHARPDLGQDDLTMVLAQSERVGTRLFGGQTLPPPET
ncbi:GAF domain-containing protein [Paracoccus sp. PAMC 22219]|uniref:GAF domain-containing protein n=1 Tax=Paracoccus sp. PAMC 22219 TaxID=1569209 RepID=UPI0006982F84|nr:GAF domain-containing protein [Paracoccus sp. PAMC 22219]